MTARTFRILSLALEKRYFSVNELADAARVAHANVLAVLDEHGAFFEIAAPPHEFGGEVISKSDAYYRLIPTRADALEALIVELVPDEFKDEFRDYANSDGPKREWTSLPAAKHALIEAQHTLEVWDKLSQQVWLIWSKLNAFKQYLREAPRLGHQVPTEWVDEAVSILRSAQDIGRRISLTGAPPETSNLIGENQYSVDIAQWEALSCAFQAYLDQKKRLSHSQTVEAAEIHTIRPALRTEPIRAFYLPLNLMSKPLNRITLRLLPCGETNWRRALQYKLANSFPLMASVFAMSVLPFAAFGVYQHQELLRNKQLTVQYEIELIREQLAQPGSTRGPVASAALPAIPPCLAELASPRARGEDKFRKPVAAKVLKPQEAGVYAFEGAKINPQVLAAENGVVAHVRQDTGKQDGMVLIRHADGFVTAYLHTGRILVNNCQSVSRGDLIAQETPLGSSKQPPFRFVVRQNSRPVNVALAEND